MAVNVGSILSIYFSLSGSTLQFYAETEQCERSMFHDVYRMHKELRDASLKPTADVSCLRTTVEVWLTTDCKILCVVASSSYFRA